MRQEVQTCFTQLAHFYVKRGTLHQCTSTKAVTFTNTVVSIDVILLTKTDFRCMETKVKHSEVREWKTYRWLCNLTLSAPNHALKWAQCKGKALSLYNKRLQHKALVGKENWILHKSCLCCASGLTTGKDVPSKVEWRDQTFLPAECHRHLGISWGSALEELVVKKDTASTAIQ